MHARVDGHGGRQLLLDLPLARFLRSPLMHRKAEMSLCENGEALLRDYLGDGYGPGDDDEDLAMTLAEALELASGYALHSVELGPADIAYARSRFQPGWALHGSEPPPAPLCA